MTRPLRLIDTGLGPARRNIAVTAALAELHQAGRIPDTLRLHRYPRSVLLGRSQRLEPAITAACRAQGAELARRVTGGGAVAMGEGVLAWDLVLSREGFADLDAAAARIGGAVVSALGALGFDAGFRAPGDILLGGTKVAGTSGLFDGPSLLHQGSLLVCADTAGMAALLGMPGLPVTVLADHGRISMAGAADGLARSVARALDRPLEVADLGATETALADRLLAEEIGRDDFVTGMAEVVAR